MRREYKIDGFRFDIMSFHFVKNMEDIQMALAKLTPEKDGIDGSQDLYLRRGLQLRRDGEQTAGPNASQMNLYGMGSGASTIAFATGCAAAARLTDLRVQGFATGLFTDPSTYTTQNTSLHGQKAHVAASLRLDSRGADGQPARLLLYGQRPER